MTRTKTAEPQTRRTLEDFPAVAEAQEKLNTLHDQRRQLQRTVDAEHERLEKIRNSSRVPVDRCTVAALQLLDATPADDPPLDIAALANEISILGRAIEIQIERLERVKQSAQREARGDYVDLHKQIKARLLSAGEQLLAAAREDQQFHTMLYAEDITFGAPLEPLGQPKLFSNSGNGERGLLEAWLEELRATYQK
jgi:hypothetical protein